MQDINDHPSFQRLKRRVERLEEQIDKLLAPRTSVFVETTARPDLAKNMSEILRQIREDDLSRPKGGGTAPPDLMLVGTNVAAGIKGCKLRFRQGLRLADLNNGQREMIREWLTALVGAKFTDQKIGKRCEPVRSKHLILKLRKFLGVKR